MPQAKPYVGRRVVWFPQVNLPIRRQALDTAHAVCDQLNLLATSACRRLKVAPLRALFYERRFLTES